MGSALVEGSEIDVLRHDHCIICISANPGVLNNLNLINIIGLFLTTGRLHWFIAFCLLLADSK